MIRIMVGTNSPYLEELQFLLAKMGQQAGTLPRTAAAINDGAKFIKNTWQRYATGEHPLPGITPLKNPSIKYARSIHINKIGPFQYEIISEAEIADWIENGTERLDMKTTHPYGPRSRVSKKGVPYLVIPFRWGTPEGHDGKRVGFRNIMPDAVYNIVKNKKKFRQTKALMTTHNEPNARGEQVERRNYSDAMGNTAWGDRLTAEMSEEVTPNMEGMSSMVGQNRRAAGYFTFRIISANSPGHSWIKPAMPARNVTKGVQKYTEDTIESMVDAAIGEDFGL
jgi:hypothetical protein